MTSEDAHHIEQYLLNPSALAPDARRAVERLMANDAAAREWHRMLQAFYETLDATEAVSPAVDDFLDTLFAQPNVVHLHAEPGPSSGAPTVMAADTASIQGGFETIAVLRADDSGVLIRVLRDRSTNEGRLYLLARGQETWTHGLVRFPDADVAVPVGASGRATVPELATVDPASLQRAALHRMLAETRVDSAALSGDDALPWSHTFTSGHTLRLQSAEGGLGVHCALQDVDAPAPQYVVVQPASVDGSADARIVAVESGTARLDDLPEASTYAIRLYA